MMAAEPTTVPEGYLDVAGLDHVPYQELTERREWLLEVIGTAGPGADHAGVRTAALVLQAVLTELDTRAVAYLKAADLSYWCACGYQCTGLAAFDVHLDQYPPENPDSQRHEEITGARPTAARVSKT